MGAYNNQVSLGQSFSANGVAYLTGPDKSVLAFDTTPNTLSNVLVSINGSTPASWTARVDRSYHNIPFVVVESDRSSSTFTANTATATQTVTDRGYSVTTGQIRKLASLGYL